MMKRLREARKGSRTVGGVTLQLMSSSEKRTLITKVLAECHKKFLQTIACKRAFHSTSTWLPVAHLEANKSVATKDQYYAPEELGVKLQHLPEYKYIDQFPKNKFLEEVVARKRKEYEERKEEKKRESKEASARE